MAKKTYHLTIFIGAQQMQANTHPILDSYQHQIDASRHIAEVVFDGADRMEHLLLDATRKAVDERMRFYQTLAAARDPQGIAALQTEFLSHTPEKLLKVQQEVMKIVTESQAQISKSLPWGGNGSGAGAGAESSYAQAPSPLEGLTNMYAMWDKAFKNTVAMATNTMTSVLSPAQSAHEDATTAEQLTTRKSRKTK
jgi:phasin family protein